MYALQLRCSAGDAGYLGLASSLKLGECGRQGSQIVVLRSIPWPASLSSGIQALPALFPLRLVGRAPDAWHAAHQASLLVLDRWGCEGSCLPLHQHLFAAILFGWRCHGIRWQGLLCGASSLFLLVTGWPCSRLERCWLLSPSRSTASSTMAWSRGLARRQRLHLHLP